MKILMVCLGNICRSSLAEGILANKIKQNNLSHKVDSAGTASYHVGEFPDPRSIEVANKYGIDLSKQRARQFNESDFEEFDLIYAMDVENYNNIIKLANKDSDNQKVKLILNEITPGENASVPDPYYGGENGFENVYQMLDLACDTIIENIK